MSLDNLPSALTQHKAWLLWKFVQQEDGKKPLKMPIYAKSGKWRKGTHGSREDRQQLVPFEDALRVMEKGKKGYNGLGMALLPEWKLVAVDFDDCVVSGVVVPAVLELVAPTYWEYSPSGKGVRAFFTGHVRDAKSINKVFKAERGFGVEFFCSKGFVTVTGKVDEDIVGLVGSDVVPLTPGIMALYDDAIGSRDADTENDQQATVGMTDDEIKRMLESWDADCDYETWLNVGMAIHHETHGEGFDLWNEWSSGGADYPGETECQYKWESFGRAGKKSLKTIRWMINEKGIDFTLENAMEDSELGGKLPPLTDKKGVVRKGIPALEMDGKGKVESIPRNVLAWLRRPDLTGMELAYDTFRDELMWQPYGEQLAWRAFTDADYMTLREHLDFKGFKPVGRELIRDAVHKVATESTIDTATLWLESLVWDGTPRVVGFMHNYMGTEDSPYARALSLYAWTAHAGRVMEPGCEADIMPVLVGGQRMGKSESIAALAPSRDYFTEIDFKQRDDDLARRMRGIVVAECAELQGMAGRELESVKAFIPRTHEDWVPKYKEFKSTFARRLVFWGTSNRDDFLTDTTGNRRFAPIRTVTGCQRAWIERDREQLWAEARVLWEMLGVEDEELVRLAKQVHEDFTRIDEWEELVRDMLENKRDEDGTLFGDRDVLRLDELYLEAVGLPAASRNNFTGMRLRDVMSRLNYKYEMGRIDGKRVRGYWKHAK